jgi:hypothetical protein
MASKSEYLPLDKMGSVIPSLFPSAHVLHEYSQTHTIIKVTIRDLLRAPIKNWQYNRPPDMVRCGDIARYIYNSKKYLDTMFYVSFNNIKGCFEVIDGIHRYTALQIIYTNNCDPVLDLLTPGEFGNSGDAEWLYTSYVIVNVRMNACEAELIDLFKTINKSNPIPELYVRDIVSDKREVIEKVAIDWQKKYKSHFSPSVHPYKPNVNRDRFIDLLDTLYDRLDISNERKDLLAQRLDQINTTILYNIPKKLSLSIQEKCLKSGCWLFIYSNEELLKMVK